MASWIFTITNALNADGDIVTLRFSDTGYVDNSENYYEPRIITPALVAISANDGGTLGIFDSPSVGDIELTNRDGALNDLVDYAVDGREANLVYTDGATDTIIYSGVVAALFENNGVINIKLKAPHETFNDNYPLSTYVGDNVLPVGLEGVESDIKDKSKPQVFGDCRNISPILVNSSLLIYQASSRSDCIITAVYDDGVRLTNFVANGLHTAGATTIALKNGLGIIATGKKVKFANHDTIYTISTGLISGIIVLNNGLTANVPNNIAVDVVDWYANTTELQAYDYQVANEYVAGIKTIAVGGGSGNINSGDLIIFASHQAVYTVASGLSAGQIVLSTGLVQPIRATEFLHVIGDTPALWGSYQGYIRLANAPVGTITCDAVSLDNTNAIHKTGDVLNLIATAIGLTVDADSITEINTAGTIGLYIDSQIATGEIMNKIVKSVFGYYHIINTTLYANLMRVPATTADFTIEEGQIKRIERSALGLGSNGLVLKAVHILYDRIETVQSTLAGGVSDSWRQRLKNQYRELTSTDSTVATKHPLALTLEIESLLRSLGNLATRVLNVVKVRRDVVTIEAIFTELPTFDIGDTVKIITPRCGYDAGRKLVIIGYTTDQKAKTITLKAYG